MLYRKYLIYKNFEGYQLTEYDLNICNILDKYVTTNKMVISNIGGNYFTYISGQPIGSNMIICDYYPNDKSIIINGVFLKLFNTKIDIQIIVDWISCIYDLEIDTNKVYKEW